MTAARRSLAAIAWVVAAIVIALGAAGIVTGMGAPTTDSDRPELTVRGDATVTPALDAAEAELRGLADDVAALATEARGALAALNGSDIATVEASVARGDELVAAIRDRARDVQESLDATPVLGTPEAEYTVSEAVRERHARLVEAAMLTSGLDAAWVRLTTGSVAASRLSARLADHDEAVLAAARLGRSGDYEEAVAALDDADAAIADARSLRDRLAATVDVTTLDAWLDRNAEYDAALRRLYLALADLEGRVTDEVREARAAERLARERLPPDGRGMVLIMAEIGRGGMNGAVIAIEEARGALIQALAEAVATPSPDVTPSASPADPTPPS
jgi:hypothetical protein